MLNSTLTLFCFYNKLCLPKCGPAGGVWIEFAPSSPFAAAALPAGFNMDGRILGRLDGGAEGWTGNERKFWTDYFSNYVITAIDTELAPPRLGWLFGNLPSPQVCASLISWAIGPGACRGCQH